MKQKESDLAPANLEGYDQASISGLSSRCMSTKAKD